MLPHVTLLRRDVLILIDEFINPFINTNAELDWYSREYMTGTYMIGTAQHTVSTRVSFILHYHSEVLVLKFLSQLALTWEGVYVDETHCRQKETLSYLQITDYYYFCSFDG